MLNCIIQEFKLNVEETLSYRTNFIFESITIIGLYIGLIFMGSGFSLTQVYSSNSNRVDLLLVGYVLWTFSSIAINCCSDIICSESKQGTLEQKYLSIIPLPILFLVNCITNILFESIIMFCLILISNIFSKTNITFNLSTILVTVLTLVGMYGIGLLFGGIALKEKRILKVIFLFQTLMLFICNTITTFPENIKLNKIIPLTLGNDLIRRISVNEIIKLEDILFLSCISMFWLIVGYMCYKYFENISKSQGILGNY